MKSYSIHDFEKRINRLRERIQESDLSKENKKLLLDFERFCSAEGLSIGRRLKLVHHIFIFATRYFKSAFQGAVAKKIWDAVYEIESSNLAPWTKHDFKVAIRKFFKFVEWGNDALMRKDYPDSVAGISTRVKKKDQVRIQASDILTEEEVKKIISGANDSQKKALFSLMYELGARVSEIGSMRIGSVSRDQYSYICDLNGKTGPRSVRVILSAGALTSWLNLHPQRSSPEAPLWGFVLKGKWNPITYPQIGRILKSLSNAAGIKKRVHPHLFRHSRITHVLANGQLNEAQAKVYFGLVADSNMLATYSHLISKDANDAVLKMYGISHERKREAPTPKKCGMCCELNDKDSIYCARCGYSLSGDAPHETVSRINAAGETVSQFLNQPGIEEAFRKMVRKELEQILAHSPQKQSALLSKPNPEQNLLSE